MNPNVAAAARLYEAVNARDWDGLREVIDPRVEWHQRTQTPEHTVYRGFDELLQKLVLAQLVEPFDDFRVVPAEFVEAGDDVAVVSDLRATGRGSGLQFEMRAVHMLRFEAGRVIWAYDIAGDSLPPS